MFDTIRKFFGQTKQDRPAGCGGLVDPCTDLFETAAVATIVIGKDESVLRVNQAFEQMCGWDRREIVGKKTLQALFAPDDAEKIARHLHDIGKLAEGSSPAVISAEIIDRSCRHLPVVLLTRRVPDSPQAIVSIVDSSAQKRLEEMLRSNKEQFRALVESLPIGAYRNKLENPGKFLWANEALVRMYGYESLADLIKNPVLGTYVHKEDRDRFIAEIRQSGRVRNFDVEQKRRNGRNFTARINARARKNREGMVEWVEGTVEDLTAAQALADRDGQKNRIAAAALDSVVGICICTTDCTGTITFINRVSLLELGYDEADLVGRESPLIFHDNGELDERAQVLAGETGRAVTGFKVFSVPARQNGFDMREWTWIARDGRRLQVNLTVAPLREGNGKQTGYLFFAREITAYKKLEDAFRKENLRMSWVIHNLPDATFAINAEGEVIAWNRAMEESTGVDAVDILGKGDFEYALPFYGDRRPLLIDLIDETDEMIAGWGYGHVKRKGNVVMAETPTVDASNTLRILWGIAAPIFDADGNRVGAIESIADVTERRKRETALQDNVVKYRKILNFTGTATVIIEEDDTISYMNPEFGRMLGYVKEEVEGKKKWTEFVVPDDVRTMQGVWQRAEFDEDPVRHELRFIRWDGEVRNGYLTITRLPGSGRVVVTLLDITENVQAVKAVQEANRKLNVLNSITRHDILNQLTVLKGNLELAREQTSDSADSAVLEKELAAAEAIQSLITFTRDYQDIGSEPPVWQALRDVIVRSCQGLRLEPVTLDVEIEGVEVYADRQLVRVFADLIKNALVHGERTTRIRIYCQESFEELHIICEDDGIGVPPEAKDRIFSREFFFRTGLDMYLAREILSITRIGIRETGRYGEGAEFELRVPKGGYRFAQKESGEIIP